MSEEMAGPPMDSVLHRMSDMDALGTSEDGVSSVSPISSEFVLDEIISYEIFGPELEEPVDDSKTCPRGRHHAVEHPGKVMTTVSTFSEGNSSSTAPRRAFQGVGS